MTTKCPSCFSLFEIPPALYGQPGRCSECEEVFQLPSGKAVTEEVATVSEVNKGGIVLKDPKAPSIFFALLLLGAIIAGIWGTVTQLPLNSDKVNELPAWTQFLGRTHPLIVHLPIGILLVVGLLEFCTFRKFRRRIAPATTGLLWLGTIGAVVAATVGYLLAREGSTAPSLTRSHMILGFAVLVLSGLALVLKICFENSRTFLNRILYLAVLALTLLGVGLTGHVGGSMTHGPSYLTKYMPAPMKDGMDKSLGLLDSTFLKLGAPPLLGTIDENKDAGDKDPEGAKDGENGGDDKTTLAGPPQGENSEPSIPEDPELYAGLIQPIFDAKCVTCHGEEKTKGKLRMDSFDLVMKGGSEGDNVIPGDVEASLLTYRIDLEEDDDEHMPPEDKEQLTEEEKALLRAWIKSGAKSEGKLSAANLSPEEVKAASAVRTALIATAGGAAATTLAVDEGSKPVSEAAPAKTYTEEEKKEAAKVLTEEVGASLQFVSQKDKVYDFTALNAADKFGDDQLALLSRLGGEVERVNLARTKITDAGLEHLAGLSNLKALHLENTAVTDEGLKHLAGLEKLEYLNLYGTEVTDAGVRQLAELPALKKLYLWQTKATSNAGTALEWFNPDLEVNMGTNLVPVKPAAPEPAPEPKPAEKKEEPKKPAATPKPAEAKPTPKPTPAPAPKPAEPKKETTKPVEKPVAKPKVDEKKPAPAPKSNPAKPAEKPAPTPTEKKKAEPTKPSPKPTERKAIPVKPAPVEKKTPAPVEKKAEPVKPAPTPPKGPKPQIRPPAEVIKPDQN